MDRRCVARGIGEAQECSGLAPMYPAFGWSRVAPGQHGCKRAFDLINGQASSGAMWVTSSRSRREDRCSIASFLSRRPWRGMRSQPDNPPSSVHFSCSTAPQAFSRPDRRMPRPARAEAVKADPFQGHPKGSALRASSTVARSHSWAPYAGWEVGSGIFRISKLRP
jgi:hypothetical protein